MTATSSPSSTKGSPALPPRRVETPALLCTLYALAAVTIAGTGVSTALIGFAAFAIVAGAIATRAGRPTSREVRVAWLNASAIFAVALLIGWMFFEIPPEQALVVICLFLMLRCWLIERREWDYMQVWLLSTMLLHVAALALGGLWGALVVLGWGVSTIQLFNVLATLRSNPGADPYQSAPRSLSSATLHLPIFVLLSAVLMVAAPRYKSIEPDHSPETRSRFVFMRSTGMAEGGVNLGEPAVIQADPTVAFRVIDPPPTLLPQIARFRVDVLDAFDGVRWTRSPSDAPSAPNHNGQVVVRDVGPLPEGAAVRYEIWLAAHRMARPPLSRRTVALERLPLDTEVSAYGDGTVEFRGARPPSKWQVLATLNEPFPSVDPPSPQDLVVPDPLLASTEVLADEVFRAAETEDHKLQAQYAAMWLRRHGRYTLDLSGLRPGIDGVRDFMGGRLEGNCELFASALATVLRFKGIPARMVVGYRGGEYAPSMVPGSSRPDLVFTNEHAHAWVECWIEGEGWIECEATPVNELGVGNEGDGQAPTAILSASMKEMNRLGGLLDSYDARAQQAMVAGLKGRMITRLQRIDNGSLYRVGDRFLTNAREPGFLWLVAALLALNLLAWWLRHRIGLDRLGVRNPRAAGQAGMLPAPLEELAGVLRRRGIAPPRVPDSGGAIFIRDAVRRLGASDQLGEQMVCLYEEWRFGAVDSTRSAALLDRYRGLLAGLPTVTHSAGRG
ncbi:DUF3488 domain-containing protein [bacterium]|nr:DUF3488 domain-containing protein [bacterium]